MKKQIVKRMIALALATALLGSLMACGQETSEDGSGEDVGNNASQSQEPITITVSGVTGGTAIWEDTATVKGIEEKFGIKMDITTYNDDAWSTQLSLMLAEDSLPDLCIRAWMGKPTANQAGMDGYLLDLSQYLDIMPNFAKFLEEHPAYAAYTTAPNGAIYGFYNVRANENTNAMSQIYVANEDLEKYDIDPATLNTTEGFYQALKKVQAADPDKIPFSLTFDKESGQRTEWILRNAFGVYSVEHYYMLGVDEEDQVFLYDTTDNYREYLKYMNRLYEEKLLDNDAFIMTTDEFEAKIREQEVVFFNSWNDVFALSPLVAAEEDSWANHYQLLVGMTSDYAQQTTYTYYPYYSQGNNVFVSANTEYPEEICKLLDYVFSEEGIDFFWYGIEGETFEYITDDLGNHIPNQDNFWDSENYDSILEWSNAKVVINGALQIVNDDVKDRYISNATDEELRSIIDNAAPLDYLPKAALELAIREQCEAEVYGMPFLVYTDEESEEMSTLKADLSSYLQQMKSEFIRGESDVDSDAVWEEYLAKVKEIGVDELLAIEQSAYDRYASNLE